MILSSRQADCCPPASPRRSSLAFLLALTVAGVNCLAAAPANDAFAMATVLSGTSASDSASNSGAGKETGEPDHAGDTGGLSLWWEWTAPDDGLLTLSTAGSLTGFGLPLDTVLAIYTGSAVDGLTEVGSNDEDTTGLGTSRVLAFVSSGTTYRIAVDSPAAFAEPAVGTFALSLSLDINGANDNLADRNVLSGEHGSFFWTNRDATAEAGEATHGAAGGASVWWEWTATFDGPVTFTTETSAANVPEGGQLDTLIAVYEGDGSSHASLSVIANDDDTGSNLSSLLILNAETGKKYFIAIDGKNGASGDFHFCFSRGLPARIDAIERLGDGSTRLTITTAAACRLRIEANPDLSNPAGWSRVPSGRLNDQVGTFQFTDASSIGKDALFYRVSNP